jgi:predicted dithiol-disulfide oxidoreductase (DUF899 family)
MSSASRTVTRDEWLTARRAFLEREKAFDRERDALAAARRALPHVKVDKRYLFRDESGERTLLDLFEGQPQLIVYHFMLGPNASEGCPGCSYVADNIEGGFRHFADFGTGRPGAGERPGLSCFTREGNDVFHTYSTYERGLDMLLGTYNYLDLTPLGRHEEGLPFPMAWVRHHDRYASK